MPCLPKVYSSSSACVLPSKCLPFFCMCPVCLSSSSYLACVLPMHVPTCLKILLLFLQGFLFGVWFLLRLLLHIFSLLPLHVSRLPNLFLVQNVSACLKFLFILHVCCLHNVFSSTCGLFFFLFFFFRMCPACLKFLLLLNVSCLPKVSSFASVPTNYVLDSSSACVPPA